MTGAFGWHLPIWCDTSLPEISWWAFHSPYSFYYSRNALISFGAQKMRLETGEKVFGHTKKAEPFGSTTTEIFATLLLLVFISRSRARCNAILPGLLLCLFSFPAHGRDATVPYPLQAVPYLDAPVCANRLLLLFGTVFFRAQKRCSMHVRAQNQQISSLFDILRTAKAVGFLLPLASRRNESLI